MAALAYIGMGSNVGDRARTLMTAAKMLSELPGVEVRKLSAMIETDPVGGPEDQPKYLNAALEISTDLSPHDLLAALNVIEDALGRDRSTEKRWGPRTCDLDILLMEGVVMSEPDLTIPHPRMHERVFVLRPLASIAADAIHPTLKQGIADLLIEAEVSR